jgi:hypothetical protein
MSWLGSDPQLEPGERLVWQANAKLALPRMAVRGTLYLTSGRLLHVPGRLGRDRELHAWRPEDITSVYGAQPRDRTIYRETRPEGGSLNRRVHVRLRDGSAVLFNLKRRDEALEVLQRELAARQAS